jgi:hypothetical protein
MDQKWQHTGQMSEVQLSCGLISGEILHLLSMEQSLA